MKERIRDITRFANNTKDEHMGAFAAQSAFFIFLSFFPIINIIISLPRVLLLSEDQVLDIIYYVLPNRFESYVGDTVMEMYQHSSGSLTIISFVIAVWSAAKGLMAVRNGLNEVYRSREQRNYFIIRSISSVYTIALVILLLVLSVLNMFGTQIAKFVLSQFPQYANEAWLVISLRGAATFVLLFVMFELMYTIVPTKKLRFKNQVPGAIFAAFAWVSVTKIFSLYIDIYASKSYMYGSLTTVIMLMFWMYFVIYFVFIGAQINEYLQSCRDREEEYELSRYHKDATEVWDDDEIDDPELGEFTREEMDELLNESLVTSDVQSDSLSKKREE
ncbi:MAG: YihY/virulence factor BrkB family protein [Eubacterium sp.]|nr:YihY/virulence factor BrkB family protein [Eubacterium sp.]